MGPIKIRVLFCVRMVYFGFFLLPKAFSSPNKGMKSELEIPLKKPYFFQIIG
jgi:hypothetical protein